MPIEVELRSFLSEEQYKELLDFFKKDAKEIKEDFQETYYFDSEQDLRIQKNNAGSKIWLKKGNIHDDFREEIEIRLKQDDFSKIKEIFFELGFGVDIKWLRKRNQFEWRGIKVCLDFTKGYGYIIELEKLCSEDEKEEALQELKERFQEINIVLTPKEEFNKRFEEYKQNWRQLISNESSIN
jgi:predicted adenylyl cyclase CyaB